MDEVKDRPWWWPFGRTHVGVWACGTPHPIYDGDHCRRTRFHRGSHLHPDAGYWL